MTAVLENTSVLIVGFSATNFFDQACLSLGAPRRSRNEKGRRKRGALWGAIWLRSLDSNQGPSGYEPDELPLLHSASPIIPASFWSPETSVIPGHGLGVAFGDGGAGLGVPV